MTRTEWLNLLRWLAFILAVAVLLSAASAQAQPVTPLPMAYPDTRLPLVAVWTGVLK